jgi:hypothetical protein
MTGEEEEMEESGGDEGQGRRLFQVPFSLRNQANKNKNKFFYFLFVYLINY